ncbi:unnamed protein product [Aphis gossypii]|uniref:Uncharacterized protein n=2 Tax=Aphis gossypii TaxID=80765 RepID=A0A9P0NCB6_APHGO|nr:unnamed protein product [Aphis gossypii]
MNGETFHDAKTGNELPNINIDVPTNILEQKVKTLEEPYRVEKDTQTHRELQLHRFQEPCMMQLAQAYDINKTDTCKLLEIVQKLQNTVEKQKFIVENKNNCEDIQYLKLDMITVKNNLNKLITNIDDLRNKMMFIERTIEIRNNKFSKLKNRIGILEKEVTKNTTHIIEMNYSYQTLMFTSMNFGAGRDVSSPLNTSTSSSASLNLPPPPTSPPPPPTPPPPPPPPSLPLTTKTGIETSRKVVHETTANTSKAAMKTEKGYFRIPITEEILKSVVLKPPGQWTAGKKCSAK